MRYSYPIIHWFIAVLVGPIFFDLYMFANASSGSGDPGILWPFTTMVGAIMSLPILGLYVLLFRAVREAPMSELFLKCLMDILVVGLTGMALALLGGSMMPALFLCYAMAIIFGSLVLRFRKGEEEHGTRPE